MAFLKRLTATKSVLSFWLLSYLSILLVPVIASVFLHNQSERIVRRSIDEVNAAKLSHVRQTVDNYFRLIESLYVQVNLNPRVQSLLYDKEPLNEVSRYTIYQLIKDMRNYFVVNNFIKYYYVYFRANDYVVTPEGWMDSASLFDWLHSGSMAEIAQWRSLVERSSPGEFHVLPARSGAEDPRSTVLFIRSLPLQDPALTLGNLVIVLDKQILLDSIRSAEVGDTSHVVILDEHEQVVAASLPAGAASGLRYSEIQTDGTHSRMEIGGTPMVVSAIASGVENWKLVSVVPQALVFEKLVYLRKIAAVSLAACMGIGLAVAFLFARLNYNPIQELTQFVLSRSDLHFGSKYNEYAVIRRLVQDTVHEREVLDERMEEHNALVRERILRRLLYGEQPGGVLSADELRVLQSLGRKDRYCVLLVQTEGPAPTAREWRHMDSTAHAEMPKFMVRSVIEEFFSEAGAAESVEVDGRVAFVVKVGNGQLYQRSVGIVRQAQRFVRQQYQVRFLAALSNVHNGLDGVSAAYREAREAMEYKLLLKRDDVIAYGSIRNADATYYYPLEVEQQLMAALAAGDAASAHDTVDDLFARNTEGEPTSVNMVKCFVFDLTSTIVKSVEALYDRSDGNRPLADILPLDAIAHSGSVERVRASFHEVVDRIAAYAEGHKKSHNVALRDRILAHVQAQHADPNLGLSSVADCFGLNPTYVSRFFKEQTGERLSDHICRVRVQRAKEAMEGPRKKLSQIALEVGYQNVDTFIRVFKKIEGTTPGRYMDSLSPGSERESPVADGR